MPSCSRYLATVRRATLRPWALRASRWRRRRAAWRGFPCSTMSWIASRTPALETSVAVGGGVAGGEEAPHFHHAVGREDVFAGDGARDGGGVHADGFGDLVHGERPEVARAEVQKLGLVDDDLLGDGEDGFLALVEGLIRVRPSRSWLRR